MRRHPWGTRGFHDVAVPHCRIGPPCLWPNPAIGPWNPGSARDSLGRTLGADMRPTHLHATARPARRIISEDANTVRVVVLADTHLKRHWPGRRLSDATIDVVRTADVVLHAGDITEPEHVAALREFAPVHAVLGNNDRELRGILPMTRSLDLGGVPVAMVHDSGPARGRERRLYERFPEARVVVFGHSHIPWNARGHGDQLLFNPGSPTERRRQPHRTVGVLELRDGDVTAADIVIVD